MPDEAWASWVGRAGEPVTGPYPVSVAAIGYLAEALEDERLADYLSSGGTVAPRSFVTIASRVPNWRSKSASGPESFMLAMSVPVPCDRAVNTSIDQTYLSDISVGDRITSQSTIVSIEPKTNRLGAGFRVTERIEHRNQRHELVACTDNTMFRYRASAVPTAGVTATSRPGSAAGATVEPAAPVSDFEPLRLPITMTLLAKAAGAVRDFSLLHHDAQYAQQAGHRTAFLSYSTQTAIVASAIGQWFGGDERLRRLQLRMKSPMYMGDTAICAATRSDQPGRQAGDDVINVSLLAGDRVCTDGFAEIASEGP
jgi:acyl dehydratase